MGALLSIPLAGAIPAATMVGSWVASCCGAAAMSSLRSTAGECSPKFATRVTYALYFFINSGLSWIMLTDGAIRNVERLMLNFVQIKCRGGECYGFTAVHRINLAHGLLHCLLALSLLGASNSSRTKYRLHNQYWGLKKLVWVSTIIAMFFVPDPFFIFWGNYIALPFSAIFVLIGLVLLVDFAHSWAEKCLDKLEESDNPVWKTILISSTLFMYVGALVMTLLMYLFFAGSHCSMNLAAISINVALAVVVSMASIHPRVQEVNPRAGLAQSAMVSLYCAYLTISAVASEPDDKMCNPLVRSKGTRTASIVLGAIFTFLAIAYTATRAATQSTGYHALPDSDINITVQPSRREMRKNALRIAVAEGSLPQTALNDASWFESDDDDTNSVSHSPNGNIDSDRASAPKYNYLVFHLIFFLATQYTATLLTTNVQKDLEGDFAPVGRTYFSSWVKIISAWICYALYLWSLLAPVFFPDRFE